MFFVPHVEFTGQLTRQHILVHHRPELRFHDLRGLHGSEDRSDAAMHLQRRRLAARCTGNNDFLYEAEDDADLAYYSGLERHRRTFDITGWIVFFSETILDAQRMTLERIDFFIQKAKFYDRFRDRLNERQGKVVARIFKEGNAGFKGG